MFPRGAHERARDGVAGGKGFRIGRWRSRVRGWPEVMSELPVATLADEITTQGRGQIPRLDYRRRQSGLVDALGRAARTRTR